MTTAGVKAVIRILKKTHPDAKIALDFRDPYELICAVILSAQCTDVRVNQVTPRLFRRFPAPAALAAADPGEVEAIIRPTGFFRNKAKSLVGMARGLVERHGGEVPDNMAALLELPGVARKTANVVLGAAFGRAEGITVDTHVRRVSRRLGLTKHGEPEKIEKDLMRLVPRAAWIAFSHLLIFHGRRVCHARKPACPKCALAPHCPSAGRV